MNCSHCGLSIDAKPQRRAAKALCLHADTSGMSDEQIRAYYKATAPAGDATFFANAIRKCGDRQLVLSAETLALQLADGQYSRAEAYQRLGRLQAYWRRMDFAEWDDRMLSQAVQA